MLGLVLSGGAVRGAAHLGVLDVLDGAGIRPEIVVGSSVGTAVGALHAIGVSPEEQFDVFELLSWRSLVRPSFSGDSLLTTDRFADALREHLGDRRIEDLPVIFRAVTCDIETGDAVVLEDGDLVDAVVASCALPGLFPASVRDGRMLVDGGVVNYLPVNVARDAGATQVVAVDLLPPFEPGEERPRYFFEMWLRSLYLLIRGTRPEGHDPDVLIQPDVATYSFTDFDQALDLYEQGRAAARDALPDLRERLDLETA